MLSVLVNERQISSEVHQEMRQSVIHIANMLGKLIARIEVSS